MTMKKNCDNIHTLKQIIKWVKYLNMNKSIFVKFCVATL